VEKVDWAGIDVGARTLWVELERAGARQRREYPNDVEGHRKLCRWLTKRGRTSRVCMEATGVYHLDVALALTHTAGVEVMVVNPRAMRTFAHALMRRGKTDAQDAGVHLEYARRMPFVRWQAPAPEVLQLRALARAVQALVELATAQRNRLHAAQVPAPANAVLVAELEAHLTHLEQSIERLEQAALAVIEQSPLLKRRWALLDSVPGIASRSAIRILAELAPLPADMKVREWVAYAGIDPAHHQSGTSVQRPSHISRKGNRVLRTALYMPALVAIQNDAAVRAFYERLLVRGKTKMQAVVAVMRKLLHAIWGMFASDTTFDSGKFCGSTASASAAS
jgi:transposase